MDVFHTYHLLFLLIDFNKNKTNGIIHIIVFQIFKS